MRGGAQPVSIARGSALRVALLTLVATRAAVLGIAVGARLLWGRNDVNPAYFDLGQLTQPFTSSAANLVGGVLARWDAVWYLLISTNGYDGPGGLPSPNGSDQWGASINFLPGWPIVVRVASGFAASHVAVLLAAYLMSLVAYAVALGLMYRLAELELGREAAVWSVVLLAVFPGALFFGTPYAESLFLALSIGSLYAARIGRWRSACLIAAAAALTRPPGVLLVFALWLAYRDGWGGEQRRVWWLLLVPAAFAGFLGYTWALTGDPLAYFHIGDAFRRALYDPVTAFVLSVKAAGEGFGTIFLGTGSGPDPVPNAIIDLTRLIAFVLAAALTVSGARHLPRPYTAYAAASLLVILCSGPRNHPLQWSLRYIAVVFPVFLEAGRLAVRRRRVAVAGAAVMVAGLAGVTTQFARWWFVG